MSPFSFVSCQGFCGLFPHKTCSRTCKILSTLLSPILVLANMKNGDFRYRQSPSVCQEAQLKDAWILQHITNKSAAVRLLSSFRQRRRWNAKRRCGTSRKGPVPPTYQNKTFQKLKQLLNTCNMPGKVTHQYKRYGYARFLTTTC